jgi:hypothetical protein
MECKTENMPTQKQPAQIVRTTFNVSENVTVEKVVTVKDDPDGTAYERFYLYNPPVSYMDNNTVAMSREEMEKVRDVLINL